MNKELLSLLPWRWVRDYLLPCVLFPIYYTTYVLLSWSLIILVPCIMYIYNRRRRRLYKQLFFAMKQRKLLLLILSSLWRISYNKQSRRLPSVKPLFQPSRYMTGDFILLCFSFTHHIIPSFNLLLSLVSPSLVFLSLFHIHMIGPAIQSWRRSQAAPGFID